MVISVQICANLHKSWNNTMSNDGSIIENMDLFHIHLAVLRLQNFDRNSKYNIPLPSAPLHWQNLEEIKSKRIPSKSSTSEVEFFLKNSFRIPNPSWFLRSEFFGNSDLTASAILHSNHFWFQPTLDITTRSILKIFTTKQPRQGAEIKWCDSHLEKLQAKFIND